MAKYIVTSGSYFEPFSYEELAQPLVQQTEAHLGAADAYDELEMNTQALKNYISNNPDDRKAKKLYDSYMTKLTALQNDLWENGYSANTRRMLRDARSGYSRDITRLAKAVETRQTRSGEYWALRRNNPDLVTGTDPGIAGLDNYLDDDLFGQNWYSYSGNKFTSEVAAEAQALANEFMSDYEGRIDVYRDPRMPGYLTQIIQPGFTNSDVDDAIRLTQEAVRNNTWNVSDSTRSGALANVLLRRLQSTGAYGNVSAEEFDRLIGYGAAGLKSAINEPRTQVLQDLQWALDHENSKHKSEDPEGPEDPEDPEDPGAGYALASFPIDIQSDDEGLMEKASKEFENAYKNGPVVLRDPYDSKLKPLSNWEEAMDYIYYPPTRNAIKERYGIDIAMPIEDWLGRSKQKFTYKDNAGNDRHGELKLADGQVVVRYQNPNGEYEIDKNLTQTIHDAKSQYDQWLIDLKNANPNVNFNDIAMSPGKEKKFIKSQGIDADISFKDYRSIINAKSKNGTYTGAYLIDGSDSMDPMRETYAKTIENVYYTNNKGKDTLRNYRFYKINDDNASFDSKGTTGSIENVFALNSDGSISYKSLLSIYAVAEDLLGSEPRIRINTTKGKWAVHPSMLGQDVYDVLYQKPSRTDIIGEDVDSNGREYTPVDKVKNAMLPLTDPNAVLKWSDAQQAEYMKRLINMTGVTEFAYITPKDIVRNNQLQDVLRSYIDGYVNAVLANPRDTRNLKRFRTDSKATTLTK